MKSLHLNCNIMYNPPHNYTQSSYNSIVDADVGYHHNYLPALWSLSAVAAHRQSPIAFQMDDAVLPLYFIPCNKVCTSSLIYISRCPAQQRTPLWIPYLRCAAALISSPWRRFMSDGISGQNGLIEPVYSPVQSLRKGLGNEGENDEWKTLWL